MTTTINGSGEAVKNRETIRYIPFAPGEYGGRYVGPKAKVKQKMGELIDLGWTCTYECDQSPIASVEFTTTTPAGATGSPPTDPNLDYFDTFQVLRNTVQVELLHSMHPYVSDVTNVASDICVGNLDMLKSWIANPGQGSTPGQRPDFVSSDDDDTSQDAANYLWDLYLSGARSVELKQPVLRVTRTTNPRYDAPFDVSNVDKILTTLSMISDSGVPSNFALPLVEYSDALIAQAIFAPSQVYILRADTLILKFGWLKDAVTLETQGTTKNSYVLEYKFGLYDVSRYGQPI